MVLLMCGCKEQILHNLNEVESNRLLTKLQEVSISAHKQKQPDGKWALAVASSDSIAALKFLSEQRLLRDESTSPKEKSGFITSREDQRFFLERALSHEIETTLLQIPGVLEARAHLNLPVTDPLFGRTVETQSGSASVLLVASSANFESAPIAGLVSGATGIPSKHVSVLVSTAVLPEVLVAAPTPNIETSVSTFLLANRQALGIAASVSCTVGLILVVLYLRNRVVSV